MDFRRACARGIPEPHTNRGVIVTDIKTPCGGVIPGVRVKDQTELDTRLKQLRYRSIQTANPQRCLLHPVGRHGATATRRAA